MENLTLVINVNGFSKEITDGYTALTSQILANREAVKAGGVVHQVAVIEWFNAADVGRYIAENPKTRVEFRNY